MCPKGLPLSLHGAQCGFSAHGALNKHSVVVMEGREEGREGGKRRRGGRRKGEKRRE
jgi:hypothetical protein